MGYDELKQKMQKYSNFYQIKTIGKSVLGRNIFALNKQYDKNKKWALVTGGIHARENLSTDFVCFLMDQLIGEDNFDFNISFVPLINPDGAELCLNGLKSVKDESKMKQLLQINGSRDFSLYKANANGVDLNNNFDANWEIKHTNKNIPSSQGFYGYKFHSEPESRAIVDWTKKLNLFISLSYHLKGEEIYFDFFQNKKDYERDLKIAKVFANNGYKIKSTQFTSSGGFKDWCIKYFKIPSLTIELGDDKFSHPYPKSQLINIQQKNKNFYKNLNEAYKIFQSYTNI